jgi:hypothetical protein
VRIEKGHGFTGDGYGNNCNVFGAVENLSLNLIKDKINICWEEIGVTQRLVNELKPNVSESNKESSDRLYIVVTESVNLYLIEIKDKNKCKKEKVMHGLYRYSATLGMDEIRIFERIRI